jgi:hypothetical protein
MKEGGAIESGTTRMECGRDAKVGGDDSLYNGGRRSGSGERWP